MIAYFKCLCVTRHRQLAEKLRAEGAEIRIVRGSSEWLAESKKYGSKLPFVVEDGKAREL